MTGWAGRTASYGAHDAQQGDLHLPDSHHGPAPAAGWPVVCLLHGGFWRAPHGRNQLDAVAADLAARGWAVWNLGYRRLGEDGGGWPGTLSDVGAGIDHLASLVQDGVPLDLARVVVAGHSAGGQLALWSVAQHAANSDPHGPRRVRPVAVAALAAVSDLERAHALGLGGGAVGALLDGSPVERPARYRIASPQALLPLHVPLLVAHGAGDGAVPFAMADAFAQAAQAAGDKITRVELAHAGHMDFVDPGSDAHAAFVAWLTATCPPAA